MPWIAAAIGAGGSLLGGALGADAAGDAAQAQVKAGREAQNFAYQQYLTSLGLSEPFRATGISALNDLNSFFGYAQQPYQSGVGLAQQNHAAGQAANNRIGADAVLKMLKQGMSIKDIAASGTLKSKSGITARLAKHGVTPQQLQTLQAGPYGQMQQQQVPNAGAASQGANIDVFRESPDYQLVRDEGNRDILGGYGAQGGAFSGNALRALTNFNQQHADKYIDKFIGRRMDLVDGGNRTAQMQAQASQNMGYQGANIIQNQGDARASGIANQGNMWGQALSGAANAFGNAYGQYQANRQPTGQQAYDDYQYYGQQGWGID